jgi:hypothetical protein
MFVRISFENLMPTFTMIHELFQEIVHLYHPYMDVTMYFNLIFTTIQTKIPSTLSHKVVDNILCGKHMIKHGRIWRW